MCLPLLAACLGWLAEASTGLREGAVLEGQRGGLKRLPGKGGAIRDDPGGPGRGGYAGLDAQRAGWAGWHGQQSGAAGHVGPAGQGGGRWELIQEG